MSHLSQNTTLDSTVVRGNYDRSRLQQGIVHIGLGAFHRGHQALYTDEAMAASGDLGWGIASASIHGGQLLINEMQKQDGLFTVTEKKTDGTEVTKLVQCATDQLFAGEDSSALLEKMCDRSTRIVSLTITEKGYLLNPQNGSLLMDNPLLTQDLQRNSAPRTAIGLITEALDHRRKASLPPFTVLSCDNMPDNGKRLQTAVIQFAEQMDPQLADWIRNEVAFPSTMVDRIVPAVTEGDIKYVGEKLGVRDGCAILTESFRQWVIEDRFTLGRPEWDRIDGVSFVSDVGPYEEMKLRMLNGAHSLLAYLGYLGGYTTISETMADKNYCRMARHYMLEEAATTLDMPDGTDLQHYAEQLLDRFRNPGLEHRTHQIAMDGSYKIPQRWLNGLAVLIERGLDYHCTTLGLASWMRYVSGRDEQGNDINVQDPLADRLHQIIEQQQGDPEATVRSLLAVDEVFPSALANNESFVQQLVTTYKTVVVNGAKSAVTALPIG